MTTALALPSLLPGQILENGLEIPPGLTFGEWEAALRNAEWIERASPWWVVDLVAYGRAHFGEDYSQALPDAVEDADGFHQAKLRQAEWMATVWPRNTRVPEQSYSAHRAVAKLNRDDAVALLEMTDRDGRRLTVRELARRADEQTRAIEGRAVDASGAPTDDDVLPWCPTEDELTQEARAALEARAPKGRQRSAYVAGYVRALVWADQRDAFVNWQGD